MAIVEPQPDYTVYYSTCNSGWGYREPIEIDTTIWEAWRARLANLHYLFQSYLKLVVRRVHLVVMRSDPRWRAGRWKAKT